MEFATLNTGARMPMEGFGVYQITDLDVCEKSVYEAIKAGYRLLDTAAAYGNESALGKAVKRAIADGLVKREDLFITTKVWVQDMHKAGDTYASVKRSLALSGLDYFDLYLIHQPYGDVPGAWKAMEEAKKEGKIRSIGVSNMTLKILNSFVRQFDTMPSVNQVECNPLYQQKEIRKLMAEHDVRLEAWYPLGHGDKALLENPVITALAEKYGKNPGQIILRFENQEGFIVLPKSTHEKRIKGNIDIFDFKLTDEEMKSMEALDTGKGHHDPDAPGVAEMLLANFKVHD